jgi:uncharacterized protein YceK
VQPSSCRILVALLFTLTLGGCGSAMGPAMEAFDDGRYPDAVAEFRALETSSKEWSPKKRTRYQLYRGLTHLSCGDLREATFWIGKSKAAWERDPEMLDDKDRGRMLAAWRSMGIMPGEAAP